MAAGDNLRILFIAGALNKGGAEKQFLYMLRALKEAGAEVHVLTLTQGEFHEQSLREMGIAPLYAGKGIPQRMAYVLREVQSFKPHFIQASHFYASLYAGTIGRLTGTTSIGAIRSDLYLDMQGVGRFGPWVLRLPEVLLANSRNARRNAISYGLPEQRIFLLPNVIDLNDFGRQLNATPDLRLPPGRLRIITVARLVPVKRLERFLIALADARKTAPELQGVIVGTGPEESALRETAVQAGLEPDQPHGGVLFLGERSDIPQLFAQSAACVLTSDREGFPNVLLEAMAAGLPVVSTPAGEAPELVSDGKNGFLVPFDDTGILAKRLIELAQSAALRQDLGQEGRRLVEQKFGYSTLGDNLLELYRSIARQVNNQKALSAIIPASSEPGEKVSPLY